MVDTVSSEWNLSEIRENPVVPALVDHPDKTESEYPACVTLLPEASESL